MTRKASRASAGVISGVALAVLLLSGCSAAGSDGPASNTVTKEEFDKAMTTPTDLTFWTWVPDIQNQVDLFEKAYPAINVKVENVGQGAPHYQKLRSAIDAGSGAPDVAQLNFEYMDTFALTGSLLDLVPFGAGELSDQYVDWTWKQVARGDAVYAIPQDSGPMGNLYRSDILTAAGLDAAPVTYADYAAAAEVVRTKTGSYISNLAPGDAGPVIGLLWQAGVDPFGYDGAETVNINVNSDGAKEVMSYWQDLVQKDLISVDPDFTDEWFQGLAGGKYAGWLTAAWAPVFLSGTAASTSGLWTAAPLPQWKEGDNVSGNWGGSADAVMASSANPIAAYELARWINNEQEPALKFSTDQFLFPTLNSVLADPAFSDQEAEFYGGQKVKALFAEISKTVDTNFQWLPFQDFVTSSFNETIGKAIAQKGDFSAGLDEWQKQLVDYANQQGFTVTTS